MRLFLDTCVLFPTVLREVLLGAAREGFFEPVWSERVLSEWLHVARRQGVEIVAALEIEGLRRDWPDALANAAEIEVHLPDPADLPIVAGAVGGRADGIVTLNIRDFPLRALAPLRLSRHEPDALLHSFAAENEEKMRHVVEDVQRRTEQISGREQPLRPLMKRAKLPRLGKLLG